MNFTTMKKIAFNYAQTSFSYNGKNKATKDNPRVLMNLDRLG